MWRSICPQGSFGLHLCRENQARGNAFAGNLFEEENDSFLSIGSETWDYDVADGRDEEFLAAVKNSQLAMECIPLGDDDRSAA
jgi:hypothetical protein